MHSEQNEEMTHVLYASGSLLDSADRQVAIKEVALLINKPAELVEQRLLSGQRKRIKSSSSLIKLIRLEARMRAAGFDVYIEN